MYSYISGKVRSITPTSVLIDNRGMGFLIQISLHTYSALKDLQEAQVYTHCVIKTENQANSLFVIYGFADEQERSLFQQLVSVSGVGNNTAQLILSSFEPSDLVQVLASGNVGALQKVKGIGSKTAQRIIIDLKDKVLKEAGSINITSRSGNTTRDEALSALLTLGFNRITAEKAVDRSLKDQPQGSNVEQIIKSALGHLST